MKGIKKTHTANVAAMTRPGDSTIAVYARKVVSVRRLDLAGCVRARCWAMGVKGDGPRAPASYPGLFFFSNSNDATGFVCPGGR